MLLRKVFDMVSIENEAVYWSGLMMVLRPR